MLGYNLACSGATTATHGTAAGENFKPGIDFYSDAQGRKGQALALQELAATRNVKAVVVMIGANNYGFADIVTRCVANWLTSPSWWRNYCSDDSDMTSRFTPARIAAETANVRDALLRVRDAMTNAGYGASQYTILAQTYWSPLPRGAQIRYPETGWSRQAVGGCGVWNRDADWANDTVVPALNATTRNAAAATGLANVKVLDMQTALNGRRLCENTVGLLEEQGLSSWTSPGAVDRTEWVEQIRTASTILGPYQLQEASHASYWGQLAMRNCLRLAYNGGMVRGRRVRAGGERADEPRRAADGAAVGRVRRRHRRSDERRVEQPSPRDDDSTRRDRLRRSWRIVLATRGRSATAARPQRPAVRATIAGAPPPSSMQFTDALRPAPRHEKARGVKQPAGGKEGPMRSLSAAVVAAAVAMLTLAALVPAAQASDPPTSVGRDGGAATVDRLATQAAVDTLRDGGNATDAAVTAAAVLGVTEPFSCGIGGGGFMVSYDARARQVTTLDQRERAPAAMTPESFFENGAPLAFNDARYSGMSVGVPGTVRGWARALREHGTISLAQALAPAIRVAREGFVVDAAFAAQTQENLDYFDDVPATAALYLDPDGTPHDVGTVFRNPDLAHTYELLARGRPARVLHRSARARDPADRPQPAGRRVGEPQLPARRDECERPARLPRSGAPAGPVDLPRPRRLRDGAAVERRLDHRRGAEHPRGLRPRDDDARRRAALRARGVALRVCRPQRLRRRPGLLRRPAAGAALQGLRRDTPRADRRPRRDEPRRAG